MNDKFTASSFSPEMRHWTHIFSMKYQILCFSFVIDLFLKSLGSENHWATTEYSIKDSILASGLYNEIKSHNILLNRSKSKQYIKKNKNKNKSDIFSCIFLSCHVMLFCIIVNCNNNNLVIYWAAHVTTSYCIIPTFVKYCPFLSLNLILYCFFATKLV